MNLGSNLNGQNSYNLGFRVTRTEINRLAAERKTYVATERAKLADGDETLGAAMRAAVREQAQKRDFTFED